MGENLEDKEKLNIDNKIENKDWDGNTSEDDKNVKENVNQKGKLSKAQEDKLYGILTAIVVVIIIFVVIFGICGKKFTLFGLGGESEESTEDISQGAGQDTTSDKADDLGEESGEVNTSSTGADVNSTDATGVEVPDHEIDWDATLAENSDVYAWIYIPNTAIDYPILSSAEGVDDDYYLDHNLDGSYGPYPGCIYSQRTYNTTDFTDFNLVLYGHNMKNGSMFADLHKFEDLTFFEENNYIYIYTPDTDYVYEIFAAYKITDQLIFEKYSFASDFLKIQYIDDIMNQRSTDAHISEDVTPTYEDYLITLSTCIRGDSSHRWIVQGVRVSEVDNGEN